MHTFIYCPLRRKSVFDTEIESLEDPNLVKVLKKLFTTHEKWYCLAYLVKEFPKRLIPLIVENLSIMTILNLQGHFFTHDQKKLANQIGLKLATTHKERVRIRYCRTWKRLKRAFQMPMATIAF